MAEPPRLSSDHPMVTKLLDWFRVSEKDRLVARSKWGVGVPRNLVDLPIETVAAWLQQRYADRLRAEIDQMRLSDPEYRPGDWVLVCPPYLFVSVSSIHGLLVSHTAYIPDWAVILVRSPDWWARQLIQSPHSISRSQHGVITQEGVHYRFLSIASHPVSGVD